MVKISSKVLKIDSLFYTPIEITIVLADIFPNNYTFFFRLLDRTWVQYQLKNREVIKGDTLNNLMILTFGQDFGYHEFRYEILQKVEGKEANIICEIFERKDNFNLDKDGLYVFKPLII